MLKEFKEFAMKGSVVDLAVGLIIGGAFGKIVTSFVNDILMPLLSPLMGGINLADQSFVIKEAIGENAAVLLNYGQFLSTIIDFVIVAFAIFMVIKQMNKMKKEETPEEENHQVPQRSNFLQKFETLSRTNNPNQPFTQKIPSILCLGFSLWYFFSLLFKPFDLSGTPPSFQPIHQARPGLFRTLQETQHTCIPVEFTVAQR